MGLAGLGVASLVVFEFVGQVLKQFFRDATGQPLGGDLRGGDAVDLGHRPLWIFPPDAAERLSSGTGNSPA